jgi:hypothetical protein
LVKDFDLQFGLRFKYWNSIRTSERKSALKFVKYYSNTFRIN